MRAFGREGASSIEDLRDYALTHPMATAGRLGDNAFYRHRHGAYDIAIGLSLNK